MHTTIDNESINHVGERAYNQHYEHTTNKSGRVTHHPGGRGDISQSPVTWVRELPSEDGGTSSGVHSAGTNTHGTDGQVGKNFRTNH